jgi:hypothetical protein
LPPWQEEDEYSLPIGRRKRRRKLRRIIRAIIKEEET